MTKTAVLILNYNSQPYLKNCLNSINDQTYKKFDAYLIDNNSTDNSRQYVKKYFPKVKIIRHHRNSGVGYGFNQVIKKLLNRYDYFCLLNPDIKLNPNYLQNLVKPFITNPDLDICASTVIYHHNHLIDTMGGKLTNPFLGIFSGIFGGYSLNAIPSQYKHHFFPAFFSVITGTLIRATTFKKYGYFDQDYFMYFEDIDLCWRTLLAGGQIITNPTAIMYHYGHGSVNNNSSQNKILGQIETNLLTTFYKNLSIPSLFLFLPVLVMIRFLMSLVFLPNSPQITKSKIKGIFQFLSQITTKKLIIKRKTIQKLRQKSDLSLYFYNLSTPSFKTSFVNQAHHWVSTLNQTNQRFTGERVIVKPKSDLFEISQQRYRFTTKYISKTNSILDLACGTGYGSILLSKFAKNVVGADIDQTAVHACQKQDHPSNLTYKLIKPGQTIKSFIKKFDVIVSLETIEHSHHQKNFLVDLKKYLKNNGTIILSTPNNHLSIHPPQNPFHIREFSLDQLYDFIKKIFPNCQVNCFGQTKTSHVNHSKPLKKPFLSKKISSILKSIYQFDSKHLHFLHRISHTTIYKKIGRLQNTYSYNNQIYPVQPHTNYHHPVTSIFVINFPHHQ